MPPKKNDLFDIRNKLVLITGSSRGIGFALARGLGLHGARIVLNGRDPKRLATAQKKLRAFSACFDVTCPIRVREAVAAIEKTIGPIDVLINNAGVNLRGPLEAVSDADWQKVMDLNLNAAFYVGRETAKRMIKRKRGKIINIASLMSEASRPGVGPYTAAKGGLKLLTRAMAAEWGGRNVQVNAIGPGYFRTEMTERLYRDRKFSKWVAERTPAGRWGKPEELVGAAVFLSSRASDFVNGQIIYVDGGFLSRL